MNGEKRKLMWLRLDNAAKIYPASRTSQWSNVFRLSATLFEEIDRDVLKSALEKTIRRFPSIAVKLKKGLFWYYLEEIESAPEIMEEYAHPLTRMNKKETRKCAFRVIVYKNRIALEMFHSLTDGNGALVFLKTLLAEYVKRKYNDQIPCTDGVLSCDEKANKSELEDSFLKYSGTLTQSRQENTSWQVGGTPTLGGYLNLTSFTLSSKQVLEKAHEYNVSVTTFLCAVMMKALANIKSEIDPKSKKPIKVLIPVNLRNIFESKSLRNFVLYVTPEIFPYLGEYSFEEILTVVKHKLGYENTQKQMSMKIATNVGSEKILIVRLMPLFIKNLVMKAVFKSVGERKSCLSLSNLGNVKVPNELKKHIKRFDFILGTQESSPYNCGVISFNDKMVINFIRDIKEPKLECQFHLVLRELGIVAQVNSNEKG